MITRFLTAVLALTAVFTVGLTGPASADSLVESWLGLGDDTLFTAESTDVASNAYPIREPEYFEIENPEKDEPKEEEPYQRFFPIWGEEAKAQGYELPLPIGLSIVCLGQEMQPKVENLKFGFGNNIRSREGIDIKGSTVRDVTVLGRADLWVFPFLNVYGFGGAINGHADIKANVRPFTLGGINFDGFTLDLDGDYTGVTGGVGTTIAGGYKQFFGTLDLNYSRTDLDFLEGKVDTTTATTRIGILLNSEKLGKGTFWVGGMYLNLWERLQGTIEADILPGPGTQKLNYDLNFTTENPYSALIGGMWEMTDHVHAMLEVSYGGRKSVTGQFSYRF